MSSFPLSLYFTEIQRRPGSKTNPSIRHLFLLLLYILSSTLSYHIVWTWLFFLCLPKAKNKSVVLKHFTQMKDLQFKTPLCIDLTHLSSVLLYTLKPGFCRHWLVLFTADVLPLQIQTLFLATEEFLSKDINFICSYGYGNIYMHIYYFLFHTDFYVLSIGILLWVSFHQYFQK